MRAVVMHETGGPEVLRVEQLPDPAPAAGEVLVHVEAAGVNRFDLTQRSGGAPVQLPAVLGRDAAGWIGDVEREQQSRRVLVTGAPRCYAELVVAKEENVFAIPDSLPTSAAAAMGVPYRTAWWSLVDLGGLEEGGRLLVQGGSSSTGQACIDVGKALGVEVYATGAPRRLDGLNELGAIALAYDDPKVEQLEADVVFDPIGTPTFERSVAALAREGRLVTPGAVAGGDVSLDVWALVGKRARVIGTGQAPLDGDTTRRLIELAGHGEIQPVIDRELPLEQAAEAHRAIEARETFGRVVLGTRPLHWPG